jgi:chromosome segregation ATPase
MDINQVAKMIEWLDEERRRDKSTIATLEERLAQQQDVIDTLQRRLNSMESEQTVIKAQASNSTHDLDLMDQVRQEMRQLIEDTDHKRQQAEREAARRADLERQQLSRPVQELAEKLTRLERTTTEMPALQVDKDRLSMQVVALQQRLEDTIKKLEEPDRRLAFLEEQRRQDVRRISEVETTLPEIQKQIDSIRPKVTLLEDLSIRNERKVQEVQSAERQRREQIQEFVDQQTLMVQQRDQQFNELIKRFGEQDSAMQRNMERFETWAETYRSMKQIIDDFQRISDRLERRINEVAEMQRLSEDRFRQEWSDWRSEDLKRWKQFTLSNDEVWRGHDKDFEQFVHRLDEVAQHIQPLHDSIQRLWQLERERAQLYRDRYQALLHEYDNLTQAPAENGNGDGLG